VAAHVAANADALGNLVQWAATGTPTPMYASAEERAAGITEGSRQPGSRLLDWLRLSANALEEAMDRLDETQWNAKVVTAQGRTVPATEIPWMRAREVCVHAVDLDNGVTFADLPADFLAALCDDIVAKRGDRHRRPLAPTRVERAGRPGYGTPRPDHGLPGRPGPLRDHDRGSGSA
jgi:maleylpyruvate isomerase